MNTDVGKARRLLPLAATAFAWLGLAYPAIAADLSPAAPVYKAPAIAPAPYASWGGFYIGGNAGGIRRRSTNTTTVATTGVFVTSGTETRNGFAGGGQAGYNFMLTPSILAGIEADSQYTSLSSSVVSPDGSNRHDGKFDYFGTLRGRLGYAVNNWLLYGTAGVAWGHGKITRTQLTGTLNAATPGTVEVADNTRTGWTAGAGVEWMFAHNWTGRLEYLYVDLGNDTSTFPLANRAQDISFRAHVLRFGVNYLFNYGGPVTASY